MTSRSYGSIALRGTTWQTLARILTIAIGIPTMALLARWLGPGEYGLVGLIGAVVTFFNIFADFGVAPSTARFLARDARSRARAAAILRQGLMLKLATGAGVAVMLAVLASPVASILHEPDLRWLIPIGAMLLFLRSLSAFASKIFEGLCRLDLGAVSSVISSLLYPMLALGLVYAGWGARGAIIGQALGLGCGIILAGYFIYTRFYAGVTPSSEHLYREIFGYSLPLLFISASFFIYTQSATLMVQYFLGKEQVGLYYVPIKLIDLLHLPAAAFGAAVAPLFARAVRERSHKLAQMYVRSIRLVLLLYIPVAMGLLILADPLVRLIFGEQYLASVAIVRINVPFLLSFSLSSVLSLLLDYLGYARLRAMLVFPSALLNVLLNLYMIPHFGIVGAAITSQLTYVPIVLTYTWLSAGVCGVPRRQVLILGGKIGGVGVAMGSFLFALRGLADSAEGLILVIVCSALVYGAGLFATRLVTFDDLANVRRYLRVGG